jgi:predicted TPR repeat methyltransferase
MNEGSELLHQARQCLLAHDFELAEPLLRHAITQDPKLGPAYELLGKLLYRNSRNGEAAAVYRAWLQALPTDPVAAHLVAATGGASPPERASDGFIESVFDRAAPDFDATLAKLRYRAPQLVFERAFEVLGSTSVALDVLDLGCGTGLCGEWFRPLAQWLVGVDLSSEMLGQARTRGCYDELICQEITIYVTRCTARFDVICAADVFCYFGDLSAVFASAAALLRPGGLFVFSVEERNTASSSDEDGPGLLEHGRYAHSASYLQSALMRCGLSCATLEPAVLRLERGAAVRGLVAVAKRT